MKNALLWLLLTVPCFAQSFYRLPTPYPNTTLMVCPVPSGGNPCPSPVSIFSDQGLSVPISQPATIGPTGQFGFWVASGQYTLQFGPPVSQEQIISLGGSGGGGTVTNGASLTAGLPVIGNGGVSVTVGTKTGNTTLFPTFTGAATASKCIDTDASGNLHITAADCGTGTLPSGTQGAPLTNSDGATTYGTSPIYFDTTKFTGADFGTRAKNCFTAAAAIQAQGAVCDGKAETGTPDMLVNPFDGTANLIKPILILPCTSVTTEVPIVVASGTTRATNNPGHAELAGCGQGPGESSGAGTVGGSSLIEGSSFPKCGSTAATNTKCLTATGATGGNGTTLSGTVGAATNGTSGVVTVTGSSTDFQNQLTPGCYLMTPATSASTQAVGMIDTITSPTVLTLSMNLSGGTTVSAGATYATWCPLVSFDVQAQQYNGSVNQGGSIHDLTLDGANHAGSYDAVNYYAAELNRIHDVTLRNFTAVGLDIEGNAPQSSGPYSNLFVNPGVGCFRGFTWGIVINGKTTGFQNGSPMGFNNVLVADGTGCDGATTVTGGWLINGGNIKLSDLHIERSDPGIEIVQTPSCVIGCPMFAGNTSQPASILIDRVDMSCTLGGITCVSEIEINNSFANPVSVDLRGIASSSQTTITNLIKDIPNGNTITTANNQFVEDYALDGVGTAWLTGAACADMTLGYCKAGGLFEYVAAATPVWSINATTKVMNLSAMSGFIIPSVAAFGTPPTGSILYNSTTDNVQDQTSGVANIVGIIPSSVTVVDGDPVSFTKSGSKVTLNDVSPGVATNAQTGTTYTVLTSDRMKYVSFSNAGSIAVTLPQAGSAGFANNFVFVGCDIGAGTATITPTTSTISYTTGSAYTSGASSLALTTGNCVWVYSDNTNYFGIVRGAGGVTSVFGRTGAVVAANNDYTEDLLAGAGAVKTLTEVGAGDVITHASVETGNLTAGQVFSDANSSNNNTNLGALIGVTGTSTGGIGLLVFDVSGTGDIQRWYTGGSIAAGVYTVGTLEANLTAAGAFNTAGGTVPTVGTAGGWFAIEGTAPTGASTNYGMYNDSTAHCPTVLRQATNVGCAMGVNGTNTFGTAGILDASAATGATALKVPVIAGATAGADGVIDYDSTGKSTHARAAGLDGILVTDICRTVQKNETTTADTNVLTCVPASVAGTYRISIAISVSAATSGVIAWTATYTDSNGNAQTPTNLSLFQNGAAAPALTFTTSAAGNYSAVQMIDVNNAGTNIVIKWTGGGTTTAKMSAMVEKVN